MAFKLTVPNIQPSVFHNYWYGNGEIESAVAGEFPDTTTFVVNYGDDEYRCRYQDGRFGSGLYFSKVEEVL